MKYKLRMMLLCAIMFLIYSCAKDYADEMVISDNNVVELKQSDTELRQMIEDKLALLGKQINTALGAAETEKRAAIKVKMGEWTRSLNSMINRIETLTDEEIRKQTQRLNEQVTNIKGKIADFERLNNGRIAQLEKEIKQAMEKGDADALAKLAELKKKLNDADSNIDALNLKVDKWQEQLNSIAAKDYSAVYADYKARIQALNEIDMEKRYQNIQTMLNALTISQFEALTSNDIKTINGLIGRVNDLYTRVYKQYDTIDEDLDNWASQAEGEYSALELLVSELEDIDLSNVETIIDNCNDYSDKIDAINSWIEDIPNFVDKIQTAVDNVQVKSAEANSLIEQVNAMGKDIDYDDYKYEDAINSIGEQLADDMNNKLQDLFDRYPHAWGGSLPSVSW